MLEVYVGGRGNLPAVAGALARLGPGEPHVDQATRRVSTALPDTPSAGRALYSHPASYYVTGSLLWSAGIIAVTAPLAIARYRRG